MFIVILELADVLVTVSKIFGALAMFVAILPLADVLAAVCIVEDTIAISFVILPLQPAAYPGKNAFSTLVAVIELAFEFAIFIVFDDIIWHLKLRE